MLQCCWIFLTLPLVCNGYKFLVYSPIFGYSHTNFMGAIADALTEAGHNVTVLMPIMDTDHPEKTGVKLTKSIIKVSIDPKVEEMMEKKGELLTKAWAMDPSIYSMVQMAQYMTSAFAYQCEKVFNDNALMKQLEEEKFDVGIAEPLSICGFGIFKLLNIRATIAALSSVHLDIVSEVIGEPILPSYVPGSMSTVGDRMNMVERLKNIVAEFFGKIFIRRIFDKETVFFRQKFGGKFPDYTQLLAETSYVLTNSNPYLDYPRPMLHKTVPIGGIAVSIDPGKNRLSANWDSILNERNRTVLVSFGSVAKAIYMPDQYMNSLLKVFEAMPDTTFIMKYENESTRLAEHLPNVHLSKWLPQNALLADPRLTVFVTHGGLGSTTELAHQGKPAILIPIFADQPRNALMLERHGGCLVLTKFDLESPVKLKEALHKIFSDSSYARNAKRLADMLHNQPISAKQLLLRHSEFTAKFGRLPNLDPYGRRLSFMQYYLIDIALVISIIIAGSLYVVHKLFKKCFSITVKTKKD